MTANDLERYMRMYYKSVYRTALCRCKDPHDADDAAQEVFFRLYTCGNTFNGDDHVKAWLLRCTVNLSTDILRARSRKQDIPADTSAAVYYDDKDKEQGQVFELFLQLPENNRTALYMHYCEGYHVEEIAEITGVSKSAVLSRLKRGREQLKKLIERRER